MKALQLIERKTAKARGLATYFTGKACRNGNVDEWLVANFSCLCPECREDTLEAYQLWLEEVAQRDAAKAEKTALRAAEQQARREAKLERDRRIEAARAARLKAREEIARAKQDYRRAIAGGAV